MKILVIGGSYYLGRAFTKIASKEHQITLLNRGPVSIRKYGCNAKEYKMGRNDIQKLRELPKEEYDAIVDVCAYIPEDIRLIAENLPGFSGLVKKYILISTVDVYEKKVEDKKDEYFLFSRTREYEKIVSFNCAKKNTEDELRKVCQEKSVDYTIIRPSIIYGPNNYAQRESEYIRQIVEGEEIQYPKGAESKFQLVYVKDVIEATIAACRKTPSKEYNICTDVYIGYEEFMDILVKVSDLPVKLHPVTVKEAVEGGIYYPFPIFEEPKEMYDGEKAKSELGINYTTLEEGMLKTYKAFKAIYTN